MSLQHGYTGGFAITPHDTTKFTRPCEAIYVGGAGNAVVLMASGETVTFNGLTAGQVLHVKANRVNATNTTATNLVGLWGA